MQALSHFLLIDTLSQELVTSCCVAGDIELVGMLRLFGYVIAICDVVGAHDNSGNRCLVHRATISLEAMSGGLVVPGHGRGCDDNVLQTLCMDAGLSDTTPDHSQGRTGHESGIRSEQGRTKRAY